MGHDGENLMQNITSKILEKNSAMSSAPSNFNDFYEGGESEDDTVKPQTEAHSAGVNQIAAANEEMQ